MSQSKLFLNRVVVIKSGAFVYDQKFHEGINIIRGVNGTGKTTIADLISYALGSIINEWTAEQLACDAVMVEIVVNERFFCLKRDIVPNGMAKMSIFDGDFTSAQTQIQGWSDYGPNRSDRKHSFSQQLFELLGLPVILTDDSKNLTMHQIMRLMYVDQLTATSKLLKEDKLYDNPTYRRAIGEYMLGIDDLEAHNIRQALLVANKEFERLSAELNAIYRLFGGDASQINEQALDNQINEIKAKIEALNIQKKSTVEASAEILNDDLKCRMTMLQESIDALSIERRDLEQSKREISAELIDTELFLESLLSRKHSLDQSQLTFEALGEITFKYCPSCLEPIADHVDDSCSLCKTKKIGNSRGTSYVHMLNELNFQIRESEALVNFFRKELDNINVRLPVVASQINETKLRYHDLEVTLESKDAIISEIATEIGFLRGKITAFEERREIISRVSSLQDGKSNANNRMLQLEEKLQIISIMQTQRKASIYESIGIYAASLLSADGSYEPTFDNVEEVNFDFSSDKMFVNGRSKFSASSMVVMKNSIRLAIFLHCVEDNLSRLPSFLIMDNIEDKGMIEARSQNFQHMIVEKCGELTNKYQLIFTTSMIAPDLENSVMCVGPSYKKGEHTLEFRKLPS